MRFSIIVPIYNVEEFLPTCIDSILSQDFTDYELILVNDGSKDNSPNICKEYSEKDDRIVLVSKENGGLVSARIAGAKIAQGDYVLNIDSDDYIREGYLKTISDIINENDSPDMVITSYQETTQEGQITGNPFKHSLPEGLYEGNQIDAIVHGFLYSDLLPGANYGCIAYAIWTKAVKRDLYVDNQIKVPLNVKFGEDLIVSKMLLDDDRCKKIYIRNFPGYLYRTNSNSIINNFKISDLQFYENTIKALEPVFEQNKVYMYAYRALLGRLAGLAIHSQNYREYKGEVKKSYNYRLIWSFAKRAKIAKMSPKDVYRLSAIKFRMPVLLYFYHKRQPRVA